MSILFKQDIQTGYPTSVCADCFYLRTGEEIRRYVLSNTISYSKNQVSDLNEQDQEFKISYIKVIWRLQSQGWGSTYDKLPWRKTQESAYFFLYSYRILCTILPSMLNSHPQRKGFYGKSLIHCLKIRGWDQCTSCSYTRTPICWVIEFPKRCELLVTQGLWNI